MSIIKLLDAMPQGTDAALIASPVARRYFTGFDSSDGFLVVTRNGSRFYTDSRYIEAATKKITCCDCVLGKEVYSQIAQFLKEENNVKTVAVEASYLTVLQLARLTERKELQSFEIICDGVLDEIITSLRQIKTQDEKDKILSAQKIAEAGFLHILNHIKAGVTEKELQLELDYYMLKNGGEGLSFETIAVSGKNSSMPHGVPTDKEVEIGDFITFDFGTIVDGYHSDMTRTVALGSVTDEQIKVYDTVLKAQLAALDTLSPSVTCFDADKAARDVIEKAGYGEYFGHGTGHGVGLEIHESPNLSPRSNATLCAGNIVTVEPGIYIPGKFGVRIEDMAYITADGYENLTKTDKKLIIL